MRTKGVCFLFFSAKELSRAVITTTFDLAYNQSGGVRRPWAALDRIEAYMPSLRGTGAVVYVANAGRGAQKLLRSSSGRAWPPAGTF